MAMLLRNETSKNGENGVHSPVINVKKSKSVVVEPVAESPVPKVHSVESPESPNHSPVAQSVAVAETDIDSAFGELPDDF
jgi:hypothetical protein